MLCFLDSNKKKKKKKKFHAYFIDSQETCCCKKLASKFSIESSVVFFNICRMQVEQPSWQIAKVTKRIRKSAKKTNFFFEADQKHIKKSIY